jgi:hypothetical protein
MMKINNIDAPTTTISSNEKGIHEASHDSAEEING